MATDRNLTEKELKFLNRIAKRRKLFLASSAATVIIALLVFLYHGLFIRDMNGPRFVIILLLLLSGRSYLRLYKSAVIFQKIEGNAHGNSI